MVIYLDGSKGRKWPPFKETGDSSETEGSGQFPTSLECIKKIKGKKFFKELVLIKLNSGPSGCGEVSAGLAWQDFRGRIRLSASGALDVRSRCKACAGIAVLPTDGFSTVLRPGFYPAFSYLYPQRYGDSSGKSGNINKSLILLG
jgi:hypothetical protein